jgi:hypothetical protein
MSKSQSAETQRHAEQARSQLDALLSRAVGADKRANRPAGSAITQPESRNPEHAATVPAEPAGTTAHAGVGERKARIQQQELPLDRLDRLSVRFTQDEAKLLEKARAVARGMGVKISDSAVFRLALSVFQPETMTPANLKAILAADHRRKNG